MDKIGIFFGTDTGTTRLMAKKIGRKLGEDYAAKPVNINRVSVEDFLHYNALILGTPTYGYDQLPGNDTGIQAGSWAEFLPKIQDIDFTGKCIALYGLGDQEKYPERFADSLIHLYRFFSERGADIIGFWDTESYSFEHSNSIIGGQFVGLVIDQQSQPLLTDERLKHWLDQITPDLIQRLTDLQTAMA